VGATSAIFSVVDGVLIRPLPYPEPERLVISTVLLGGEETYNHSEPEILDLMEERELFTAVAAYRTTQPLLGDGSEPERVRCLLATASLLEVLGIAPMLGRFYTAEEDQPGEEPVAVLSHGLWRRAFGGDPAIIGKIVLFENLPHTVVGVMPASFSFPTPGVEVLRPLRINRSDPVARNNHYLSVVARLTPGVSHERVEQRLQALGRQSTEAHPGFYSQTLRFRVAPLHEDLVGDVHGPLMLLMVAVALVLLIAAVNAASLFLARGQSRRAEIAVRTALGATRGALVRKLLAEALVLALAGGAAGLAIAGLALPALLRYAPPSIPRLDRVTLDGWVGLFTLAAVLVSAVLIGLMPALRYTRPQSLAALRHGGRGGTDEPARRRGRDALVVVQTAMALVLLVGSGLLLKSFAKLAATDLGFDPVNVMTFRTALPARDYPDAAAAVAFHERLLARLAEVPGAQAAGAASILPVANEAPGTAHEFEHQPVAPGQLPPMVHFKVAAPGYFDTMRIPVRRGRDFDSRDAAEDVRHVIVNQALADRYWPGEDPIGKRVRVAAGGTPTPPPWSTVVGVVGTERQDGLRRPPRPLMYYPLNGTTTSAAPGFVDYRVLDFVVRGPDMPARASALRDAVWSLDRALPLAAMRSMQEIIDRSIVEFTFTMLTLGIAAAMALILGAIGLYGVLSYAVTLRTREIGVRVALGAPPSRVMRSVIANGAAIAAIGLVVGLAGAAALTRFLSGLLYETEPLDVPTFAAMSGALFVVALVASYLPARRAASVSPVTAMRAE
jgi:predicted permease